MARGRVPGADARLRAATGQAVRSVAACVLLALCCAMASSYIVAEAIDADAQALAAKSASTLGSGAANAAALEAAEAYNEALAGSGQPLLGEADDPWGGEESASEADGDYLSQLSGTGGLMASVSYPRLGIELPVGHGTSDEVLAQGAGHLYGTSLPVGGPSTKCVVAAHRGLSGQAMFTRLGEAREGDWVYLEAAGRKLSYRVAAVLVVEPDDFSGLYVEEGRDRLVLLTCTPIGLNTQRLLVVCDRAEGEVARDWEDGLDLMAVARWALLLLVWLAWAAVSVTILRNRVVRPLSRAGRAKASWQQWVGEADGPGDGGGQ